MLKPFGKNSLLGPDSNVAVLIVVPIVSGFGRRSFGVVIAGGIYEWIVIATDTYFGPLGFCACVVYGSKAGTIIERIGADGYNAIRDGYACKTCAICERPIADACNTIRNGYTRKASATIERIIPDGCDTIQDGYACKASAIIESMVANRSNSVRNNQLCYEIAV